MPEDSKAAAATVTTRADEVRQERRRRPGSAAMSGLKLAVDHSKLDLANYHYRQVNDTPGRVSQLYDQDYDVAPEANANANGTNGLGTVNTAQAGVTDGKPFNAILMRKPRHMHEADQIEKQRPLDETEEAIRRGNPDNKANPELRGPGVYTPGTNQIDIVSKR